jgi:GcrA cell cycle regulator
MGKAWSIWDDPRADEILKAGAARGDTTRIIAAAISEALGQSCSRNSIIGRAGRTGVQLRPPPQRKPKQVNISELPETALVIHPERLKSVDPAQPARREPVEEIPGTISCGVDATINLRRNQCRWPIGDPKEENFHYCQHVTTEGVYCDEHHKIAFRPPDDRPRSRARTYF